MLVTLDKFGRIVIPKKVRQRLGINKEATLNINEDGKRIILIPLNDEEAVVEKDGFLIYTGMIQKDDSGDLQRDRKKRNEKLTDPED